MKKAGLFITITVVILGLSMTASAVVNEPGGNAEQFTLSPTPDLIPESTTIANAPAQENRGHPREESVRGRREGGDSPRKAGMRDEARGRLDWEPINRDVVRRIEPRLEEPISVEPPLFRDAPPRSELIPNEDVPEEKMQNVRERFQIRERELKDRERKYARWEDDLNAREKRIERDEMEYRMREEKRPDNRDYLEELRNMVERSVDGLERHEKAIIQLKEHAERTDGYFQRLEEFIKNQQREENEKVNHRQNELNQWQKQLDERGGELDRRQQELDARDRDMNQRNEENNRRQNDLERQQAGMNQQREEMDRRQDKQNEREENLNKRQNDFQRWEEELNRRQQELEQRTNELNEREENLQRQKQELNGWNEKLDQREREITNEIERRVKENDNDEPIIGPYGYLVLVLLFILWIWALQNCLKRKEKRFPGRSRHNKLIWTIVILTTLPIGALLYFFIVYLPSGK